MARLLAALTTLLAATLTSAPPATSKELTSEKTQQVELKDNTLSVTCRDGADLDTLRVSFTPPQETAVLQGVVVSGCAPPPAHSYRALLDDLNVVVVVQPSLELQLPSRGEPLSARHLRGLRLAKLSLSPAKGSRSRPPAVGADLLAGADTSALRHFKADAVDVASALASASAPLTHLHLRNARADRVPAALMATLQVLYVKSKTSVELEGRGAALKSLTLDGANVSRALTDWALYPNLEDLELVRWGEDGEGPAWSGCGALTSLTLRRPSVRRLPASWLGACCALLEVRVYYACELDLGALPPTLLEGCGSRPLDTLEIRNSARFQHCQSGRVPPRLAALLAPAPRLRVLDLSSNKLLSIDKGLLANLSHLETLRLNENRLDASIYGYLGNLSRTLTELDLSGNEGLGDACAADDESPLAALTSLAQLNLRGTRVSRICRDWRLRMPRLRLLQLDSTNITHLAMRDLQHPRSEVGAVVSLKDTPIVAFNYTPPSPSASVEGGGKVQARVLLDRLVLDCDCELYAAVHTWRNSPHSNVELGNVECRSVGGDVLEEGRRALKDVALEELVCPAVALCADMPAGCSCWRRPEAGGGWKVQRAGLVCEGLDRRSLPAVLPAPAEARSGYVLHWELYFRNNTIEELSALPRLHDGAQIKIVDLRDNRMGGASAVAADELVAGAASLEELRLGGNPLACDCEAPLLRVAVALGAARLSGGHCGGGDLRSLLAAADDAARECAAPTLVSAGADVALYASLGAVLAALVALAVLARVLLLRPAMRARLKGVLADWGWLPRPDGDARTFAYDAFVSFVTADLDFVKEMVRRLERPEGGATPLRLCLHHRDWAPGEWVPAQIAASVRAARRTVCVVSRAFLCSEWVRTEYLEALAASARDGGAPRLVLVLVEEPAELCLPRALRRHVAENTYLRCDSPHLWPLLHRALAAPDLAHVTV